MATQNIVLRSIDVQKMRLTVKGTTPLLTHKWSDEALRAIREKGAGKKTKNREARNPEHEGRSAIYFTADGEYGVPATAIKKSIISAAHKDLGIEKTLVCKALFVECFDGNNVLPLECSDPVIREDNVRVGMGSADLRYRPQYNDWKLTFTVRYDAELLQPETIVNLINRAGFSVGIGDWRPEKKGDFGRFEVVTD